LNRACPGKVISIDPRPTEKTLRDRNHITMQWWRDIRKQEPHYPEPSSPIVFRRSPDSQSKYRVSSEVVIHPGSGGCEKCWPWEKFLQLADALTDLQAITWMLGPVEMERMPLMCDALQARCAASNDTLILETDLKEAADYLRRARLFIGNDGGMTHLAAALGIETIAIYGPTDPRVWRPLGNHVHAVSTENVGESIEKITVEQVIQKYRQLKL
jgi:ADP-heptose:LPS heptosyltransferase